MRFPQWMKLRKVSAMRAAQLSGVSRASIQNVKIGIPLESFELATRLAGITDGEVTVAEISDPTGTICSAIAVDLLKRRARVLARQDKSRRA